VTGRWSGDREGGRGSGDRGGARHAQDGGAGVEMFRKLLDEGQAGDNIGALLRGIDKEEVERGQVLAKPGSIKTPPKIQSRSLLLTKEEGAAHAVLQRVPAAVLFSDDGRDGGVPLPSGVEMVMPGDNVTMAIELIVPIAMEKELRFAIREGGRTVRRGRRHRDRE